MKASAVFAIMSDGELKSWWGQYGRPNQATFYRTAPRRAAWSELKRRGLATPASSSWTYASRW